MPVAYYSEDSGYATFTSGQPTNLLVIDPIDGTRAAKSGYEGCVISVCSTRVIERPSIGDVDNGCVMEILGDRTYYADRGKGARVYVGGHGRKPRLSSNENLEALVWSMTVPGRPAELVFPTAARLIDLSSVKAGFSPATVRPTPSPASYPASSTPASTSRIGTTATSLPSWKTVSSTPDAETF